MLYHSRDWLAAVPADLTQQQCGYCQVRHGRMASIYTGAVTTMTDMTWTYRLDCTHAVWEHDTAGHSAGMYTDKMLCDKHHKATPVRTYHRD